MSPLEQQAFFVYWEHIGQKMGITDIPPGLDELRLWVAVRRYSVCVLGVTTEPGW